MTMTSPGLGLQIGDAALRLRLPRPWLPARPQLEQLYWRAWQIGARQVRHGTPQNGFAAEYADAAFGGNIFQWDTCLLSFFARYSHELLPVRPALDNFYAKQEADGFICREYRWENGAALWPKGSADAINPPLFAWAEWGLHCLMPDLVRLRQVLPYLVRYFDWLAANHRGFAGLYWISAMGSGMDNTPRYAAIWADISCQQALAARSIAQIAEAVGDQATAARFAEEYRSLAELINRYLWSEADGFYVDIDAAGLPVPAKTAAPFWALLAGVASPAQAARLLAHLGDPHSFWRMHPWPTLAADHPLYTPDAGYWLGGVWAPTNYMIAAGLSRYGYADLARAGTLRHLEAMARVLAQTGTIWENYCPDDDRPGIPARPDFVGWTGLGPIAMLIEHVLGIDVQAQQGLVRWRVVEPGPHGIENLRVGATTVSLRIDADRLLRADSDAALALLVQSGDQQVALQLPGGPFEFQLG